MKFCIFIATEEFIATEGITEAKEENDEEED